MGVGANRLNLRFASSPELEESVHPRAESSVDGNLRDDRPADPPALGAVPPDADGESLVGDEM